MAVSVTGYGANMLTAPGPVAHFPPSKITSPRKLKLTGDMSKSIFLD